MTLEVSSKYLLIICLDVKYMRMMGRCDIKGRRQDYIKNQQGEPHRIPL